MTEQMIGSYKILERLGSGGMGDVFRGLDVMLEREVAIKSLRPELSQREDLIGRFRSEAMAMGRLNHPYIATVYNFLFQDGQYFLVMEYVRGRTLDTILQERGPIPFAEAVPVLCKVLEGLEHAHREGIVHRDIKPSNIIITDTGLKLMDFGIARILQQARQTRSGHMVGTLEYMSPEHIQGKDTDARTDIYSVGIVAYEMLTGGLPFRKDTDYEMIKAHIEEIPQAIRPLASDVPEAVERAVFWALAKDASHRPQSAKEFAASLEASLEGVAPKAFAARVPGGAGTSGFGSLLRSRAFVWGMSGLAALAVTGAVLLGLGAFDGAPPSEGSASPTSASVSSPETRYMNMDLDKLRKLAGDGDAEAQFTLGTRYADGKGVPKDQSSAFGWYLKAAENGSAKAQYHVGGHALQGVGVAKDYALAEKWLLKASDSGYPGAAQLLGACFGEQGKHDQAIKWFEKSYQEGMTKAAANIGLEYIQAKDFQKAVPWLEKGVQAGIPGAQYTLGMVYYQGLAGEKDFKKSFDNFKKAADQGYPEAQYMLGVMFRYGNGVPIDLEQAKKYFTLAQKNNFAGAEKELRTLAEQTK